MNSRERFLAALNKESPDRTPVFYQHLGGAKWVLQAAGLTMREGFHDPEKYARICLKSRELFGFDNVMAGWGDLLTEAQAHGSTWKFPERDFYPRMDQYAVRELGGVDKLRPVEPREDPFWSVPIKAAEIMSKKIGREVGVVGGTISPFFVATELRGYESLMMDLFEAPEVVESMIRVTLESAKNYAEDIQNAGVEAVFIDDSGATGTLVSPEMAERFDVRYLKPLIDRFAQLGIRTIIHNDAQLPYLDMQAATGPSCIHFSNDFVDLPEVFRKFGDKLSLMAGINQQDLIFRRSPDEVEGAVRSTIELSGGRSGLIISGGCEIPFKSPMENILRLREAVEKHGKA